MTKQLFSIKNRRGLAALLALALALCLLPGAALADQNDSLAQQLLDDSAIGSTAGNPFLIANADQLAELSGYTLAGTSPYTTAYYKMVSNVTLSLDPTTSGWTPIGAESVGVIPDRPFSGVFDGDGHTVTGLFINRTTGQETSCAAQGLFGYVKGSATQLAQVKNVIVAYANITALQGIGAVVGVYGNYTAALTGCAMKGGSVTGQALSGGSSVDCIGGVVGIAHGEVTNCYATGNVIGRHNVGGVVGYAYKTVSNCYSTGDVLDDNPTTHTLPDSYNIGGVVGRAEANVTNCVALGDKVSGDSDVGRVVGVSLPNVKISGAYANKNMSVFLNDTIITIPDADRMTTKINGADTDNLPVTISPSSTFPQGNAPQTVVTLGAGLPGFNATNNFVSAAIMGPEGSQLTPLTPGTHYDVADGSIVLTLHPSYLNTLDPGTYTLRVNLTGRGYPSSRETRIVVTVPGGGIGGDIGPDVPKTGDGSTPLFWTGLMLLAGMGLAASAALERKKRHSR